MKTNFTITKMRFFLLAISFFGFVNFSNAQIINWTGGTDTNFYNVKNWDNTSIDFANLITVDLIIGAGSPNNPANLGFTGTETMAKRPRTFTTNTGANITITGTFFPNGLSTLNGTINVDALAAQFSMRNTAYLGKGTSGMLNINAGKVLVKNALYIGNATGGNGLVTVNSGTSLEIGNSLEIGTGVGDPIGDLRIKGGTVSVETALNIGPNGHAFISGTGKLIVTGNKEAVIKSYIKSRAVSCTVGKTLEVLFDGTKTTVRIKA
ncbi:hypothetical protein [Flavobacterium marginilacus]|uniref:hypothetical protein n=1 Tax=Flavobacterium marginilacus TaxID=3003256 RepID=UPI00248D5CD4|nr:hypothetical protein [Flavobacterium marginilacus]